jgi:hypothetical protein
MAFTNFRPSPAFTLPTIANAATLTALDANEFEQAKSNLASRGGFCQTAIGSRVNGRNLPVVGVIGGLGGGSSAWIQGFASVDWEIPIGSGIDSIDYLISLRLEQTCNVANEGVDRGGMVKLQLIMNGFLKTIQTWNYTTLPTNLQQAQGKIELSDLYKLSIDQPTYLSLVLSFDTVSGDSSLYGQFQRVGTFTNPLRFMGVDYFSFCAYRDCVGC